ncbi:DUF4158 domain-containing protein [Nonomuraea recticatena]|uniref:DUF4158 domain-containing protein n=1 Tax=Nonomuraea recticatena TaxID=46178 RepID=UPI0031F9C6CE
MIAQLRVDSRRLGVAVQTGTLRYKGLFLEDPLVVPWPMMDYLAEQLRIGDASQVKKYAVRAQTAYDHAWMIRDASPPHRPGSGLRLLRHSGRGGIRPGPGRMSGLWHRQRWPALVPRRRARARGGPCRRWTRQGPTVCVVPAPQLSGEGRTPPRALVGRAGKRPRQVAVPTAREHDERHQA